VTCYELLGDDIVIFDKKIALMYLKVMKSLGLDINMDKSVLADDVDTFEFAKRTIIKGHDVSGLP